MKKIIIPLFIAALIFTLTACGKKMIPQVNSSAQSPVKTSAKPATEINLKNTPPSVKAADIEAQNSQNAAGQAEQKIETSDLDVLLKEVDTANNRVDTEKKNLEATPAEDDVSKL
jgi:predicted small lipoprotein YifL